jgi:hypothetical protein
MTGTESPEPKFQDRDSEHGQGLLPYTPLRLEASFEFDSYYPANGSYNNYSTWVPLPDQEEASHVTFEITTSGNGTPSTFVTAAFPLVYDETVIARTPAPDNKCRREQGGTWRNRQCHVVKRLSHVCVQVELGTGGEWRLHARGDAASLAGPAPSYGCDPKTHWRPATYTVDSCWGPRHGSSRGNCAQAGSRPQHLVELMVRSSADPFLRAEELTNDKFDFGFSPGSLRAHGITMLIIGTCLGLMPVMRLCMHFCSSEDDNDKRSLRYRADEEDSRGPRGDCGDACGAEIFYGRRSASSRQ